jgi:uncharacterized membrane protein
VAWSAAAAVAAIVVVSAALPLYRLTGRSLWLDEILTSQPAHLNSPGEVIAWSQAAINQMPLFYMITWLLRLWGDGAFVLRLPAAVAGCLAVVAVFLLARRTFVTRTGLIAAVLMAILAFPVWYSQEARNYSLLMLLTTMQMYFAYRSVTDGHLLDWLGLTVFTVLDLYTHYLAFFPTAAVMLYVSAPIARDLFKASSPRIRVAAIVLSVLVAGAIKVVLSRSALRTAYALVADVLTRARSQPLVEVATAIAALGALVLVVRWLRNKSRATMATTALALLAALALAVGALTVGWADLGGPNLPLAYAVAVVVLAVAGGSASVITLLDLVRPLPGAAARLGYALAAGATVIVAYAPWLATLRIFLSRPNQTLGVISSSQASSLDQLGAELTALGLVGSMLAAFLLGAIATAVWWFRGRAAESALLACWIGVPLVLFWISLHGAIVSLDTRYLTFLYPAAVIVSAVVDGA